MDYSEFKAFDNLNTEIIILRWQMISNYSGLMMRQKPQTGLEILQNLKTRSISSLLNEETGFKSMKF